MKSATRLFLLLCLSGTALSLPAKADDLPDAVQTLLANLEQQTGAKATYESAEADGESATIKGLTIQLAASGTSPGLTYKTDTVELADISDEGDGLYQIGSATFSGTRLEMNEQGMAMSFSIPEASAEGWYVTDAGEDASAAEKVRASMNIARKISVGKMDLTTMGQTVTIDGYEQTWDGDPKTGAGNVTMKVSNLAIPESALAAADTMGVLKQLGYAGLNFDFSSEGKVDMSEEAMGFDFDFALAGKDIGTFKFGANAAGIPLAAYAELMAASKAGKEPDFNAFMPQLMGVSFGRFSVRFEDASITKKVLPMIAAMQGMDEATLVSNAGAMMQIGLMQLQNQAFTEQTVAAVNAFLKEPQSITIAAAPAAPVTVADIMGFNPAAPGEAITKLGVSVKAND